jgi:hypothetical protein
LEIVAVISVTKRKLQIRLWLANSAHYAENLRPSRYLDIVSPVRTKR